MKHRNMHLTINVAAGPVRASWKTPAKPAVHAAGRRPDANRRVRVYGGYLYVGGDVLTAVDGVPTPTRDALTIYLENNRRPGDVVKLSLLREGGSVEIDATLGAR